MSHVDMKAQGSRACCISVTHRQLRVSPRLGLIAPRTILANAQDRPLVSRTRCPYVDALLAATVYLNLNPASEPLVAGRQGQSLLNPSTPRTEKNRQVAMETTKSTTATVTLRVLKSS
jgi:hypothetical protein